MRGASPYVLPSRNQPVHFVGMARPLSKPKGPFFPKLGGLRPSLGRARIRGNFGTNPCRAKLIHASPRVLCHLTLLYRPGRTRLAKGHAYGRYFVVVVPPFFASALAAPLNGGETSARRGSGRADSWPRRCRGRSAFVGCKAFTTGKSVEAVVPWMPARPRLVEMGWFWHVCQ